MAKIYEFKAKRAGASAQIASKKVSTPKNSNPALKRLMEIVQFLLFMLVLFWFAKSCHFFPQ
jgi:hypothetical protein